MRKRIISFVGVFVIGMLFPVFSACSNGGRPTRNDYPWEIGKESELVFSDEVALTLTLDDKTLTPRGASFILQNTGEDTVSCGVQYFLQIQLDGKWLDIEKDQDWTLELFSLLPGEETELAVDWSSFYGELPPGNYRLVKEFVTSSDKTIYLACPFSIG